MTLFGIFSIALGLMMAPFAFAHATRQRIVVFLLAYFLHVVMSIFYYSLVLSGGGDSLIYYDDWMRVYGTGFTFGTVFVVYLTQGIKSVVGGTFLDYFLLFQAFGFVGLVALMRSFEEIFESLGVDQPKYTFFLLFIPGIHYWSAALGKDSLFFAAAGLSLWASIRLKQRLPAMLFAVLLMGLIRPHISAIVLAALAITVITDRQTNIVLRVLFFGAAALGVVYSLASISATYQVNLANPDAIGDQLAGREAIVQGEKGDSAGNSVVDVIYPLRILSLLFRPLFFDANGLLPLIVSFENVAVLLIVGTLAWHWRTTWRLMKAVPFVRFALLSATGTLLALALTYYNIGLGIRQKSTMILPGILVGFVALRAVLAIRAEQQAESKLPADAPGNRAPLVAAVPGLLYGRSEGRDL